MTETPTLPAWKRINWKLIVLLFSTVALALGIRWATFARPPLPDALDALVSDEAVQVTADPWLIFTPSTLSTDTGFIFYPGGRIDPRGYAALMRSIAQEGYLVVVPEMPLNMAVFNPNIAEKIMERFPDIHRWVIGGHSVGGTMAAQFTHSHRQAIAGLVIWASYPADNADLSNFNGPVVSIYGSLDSRVDQSGIERRKDLLPHKTTYLRIEGGDHHQFGSYEIRPEDHLATISQESQHAEILLGTLDLLSQVAGKE